MTRLFRSKSCGLAGTADFNRAPLSRLFDRNDSDEFEEQQGEEEEEEDEDEEEEDDYSVQSKPTSTPLTTRIRNYGNSGANNQQLPVLDFLMTALRKSLITCSVDRDDVASVDISWPTEVRHVSHVTFDRFNGFLGLPTELQREVPKRVPSASASVFGVSAKSMQCSYDERGNSIPTILLMMQKRLYSGGGLKAEGIFRINAENSQEEFLRGQLNKGVVPHGIDVHCLAGLIKAWLRELPTGVLDALTPEQVMHCNTEDECTELVKLLPSTEAALLDWSINLMADVVQYEEYNKMNARNIAMVFAPNMTQMADPLTALIHAVQVMNFLKTLILKILREREEVAAKAMLHPSPIRMDSPLSGSHEDNLAPNARVHKSPVTRSDSRCVTSDRFQTKVGQEEAESSSPPNSMPVCTEFEAEGQGNGARSMVYGSNIGDWLSWRKGMRKLCRHPVFQLSRQPTKKTRSFGFVNGNGRGEGGEAWA